MSLEALQETFVVMVAVIPMATLIVIAIAGWFQLWPGERILARCVMGSFAFAALLSTLALGHTLIAPADELTIQVGHWFAIDHYHFDLEFVGDPLALVFVTFSSALTALVAAFSQRYLHRERGFFRFYLLLTVFGVGVNVVALSHNLAMLFFGWEFVGLASALLIAFFHERKGPVENGLRAFVVYRLCDVGLLAAVLWLERSLGTTAFAAGAPWHTLGVPKDQSASLTIGALLLLATIGKSAQFPLGNWLPRAMEGPTPSSAIFYGAISVHLGPFLLLRAGPIIAAHSELQVALVAIGLLTTLHGSFVGRAQTDIKSALAYASMTQVGLIFVEIGLGLPQLALMHIIGHSAYRTLEILRSPNLISDHFHLESTIGRRQRSAPPLHLEHLFPQRTRAWFYRLALERGFHDRMLRALVVRPFQRAVCGLERMDQSFTRWIEGAPTEKEETPR